MRYPAPLSGSGILSYADLSRVERMSSWKVSDPVHRHIVVITERGLEGSWARFIGNSIAHDGTIDPIAQTVRFESTYAGRDAKLHILAREYAPDAIVDYNSPTKEMLVAAVAQRYTVRFMAAIDQQVALGMAPVSAWIATFRRALRDEGRTCLCGVLGATSGGLPTEVTTEAQQFFQAALQSAGRQRIAPRQGRAAVCHAGRRDAAGQRPGRSGGLQ